MLTTTDFPRFYPADFADLPNTERLHEAWRSTSFMVEFQRIYGDSICLVQAILARIFHRNKLPREPATSL